MATLNVEFQEGIGQFKLVSEINPSEINPGKDHLLIRDELPIIRDELLVDMNRVAGPAEVLHIMADFYLKILERGVFSSNVELSPNFIGLYNDLTPTAEFGPRPPFELFVLDYKLGNRV